MCVSTRVRYYLLYYSIVEDQIQAFRMRKKEGLGICTIFFTKTIQFAHRKKQKGDTKIAKCYGTETKL